MSLRNPMPLLTYAIALFIGGFAVPSLADHADDINPQFKGTVIESMFEQQDELAGTYYRGDDQLALQTTQGDDFYERVRIIRFSDDSTTLDERTQEGLRSLILSQRTESPVMGIHVIGWTAPEGTESERLTSQRVENVREFLQTSLNITAPIRTIVGSSEAELRSDLAQRGASGANLPNEAESVFLDQYRDPNSVAIMVETVQMSENQIELRN